MHAFIEPKPGAAVREHVILPAADGGSNLLDEVIYLTASNSQYSMRRFFASFTTQF